MARHGQEERELRSVVLGALERFDDEGTGSVHASLFLQAIEGLGLKYGMRVVDDIMCECAISEEGYVDYREFRDAVGRAQLAPPPASRRHNGRSTASASFVDAPVRPFEAHAATVAAERQATIATERRRELQVVYERYSRGFTDDAELKSELIGLGLAVTADLDAALAKSRGSNDLAFHDFYRALVAKDNGGPPLAPTECRRVGHASRPSVRETAAAGGRARRGAPDGEMDVVEEFMSFYGARKRTDPRRNASMFGDSLALGGASLADELGGVAARDGCSLTGRRVFAHEATALRGSAQVAKQLEWSYVSGETKRKEVSTDARFASTSRVAMRAGLAEPEVVGVRNSEQALQRQQIYAAVRKLGAGELTARRFQDRMFAMGVAIPPAVLKLLTDHESSGEANLSKFVSAFERYFDERQRDVGINAVDVDVRLAARLLGALKARGPHGLRAFALGLAAVATLPVRDTTDAAPTVDFSQFCSSLDRYASTDALSLPERRAFFARFDADKNGQMDPAECVAYCCATAFPGVAGGIPPKRLRLARHAFATFDRVGDGLADANEVRRAFDAARHPLAPELGAHAVRRDFASMLTADADGNLTASAWEDYYGQVSACVADDGDFAAWLEGPFRAMAGPPPAPREFRRDRATKTKAGAAVSTPLSGQNHGDIVAWAQDKSSLERRDDAHSVHRGQSRAEKSSFHFAKNFGDVSEAEASAEADRQFGVKRSSALTLAHAAGEGGILNWYAPRDERERLAASRPPRPPPSADVEGAAGGASGTFSSHPFELRTRPAHPQQNANWNRGCPYGADPPPPPTSLAAAVAKANTTVSLKHLVAN